MAFIYPEAVREDTIKDNYHGIQIEDPYRWMENVEMDRTKKFIDSQNTMMKSYLKSIKYRNQMKKCLTEMCSYPKFEVPTKEGEKYFQFRNSGMQTMDILYIGDTLELLGTQRSIFFDPNNEIPANCTLVDVKFSKNGKIMAFMLNMEESDDIEVKFKNVETREIYKDSIKHVNNSKVEWLGEEGIFYSSFLESGGETDVELFKPQTLYYHVIGKNEPDVVVFSIGSGLGELFAVVSYCEKYLCVFHSVLNKGCEIYFTDLQANGPILGRPIFKPVITTHDSCFEYVTNNDDNFVFRTDKDAPHMKIVSFDINNSDEKHWTTLIHEHYNDFLECCMPINNSHLVVLYRQNARHILKLHSLSTGNEVIDLPTEIGAVISLSGKRQHTELFLKFQSMVIPAIIYRVDFTVPHVRADIFQEVRLKDSHNYEIFQALYHSTDFTEIRMYILHKKGLVKNGLNPCMLCSYGSKNEHVYPKFSIQGVFFVNSFNGVYAVANVRGGGQLGEKWFMAGTMENKQKSFEDFQCAAKYLFQSKYTSPNRLVIYGSMRGGLLVSVCANQTPELFGAAIIDNADLDILRHNDHTYSNTRIIEYGHPHNPHHFNFLRKFSPLHNIRIPKKKVQYPATLLFVDNFKNRYKASQSLKFVAALQHIMGKLPYQRNPLMLHADPTSAHKPMSTIINEWLNMFCFIGKSLDLHYDEHPHKRKIKLQ